VNKYQKLGTILPRYFQLGQWEDFSSISSGGFHP
jgi:hypothetical protein